MLTYKGYTGSVDFDADARVFHGEIVDTRDVITFQGDSVDALERAFHGSVDDYLAFCAERGEAPDKPFSGRLMVRLPKDLHRDVYVGAKREGKSLNHFVVDRLRRSA